MPQAIKKTDKKVFYAGRERSVYIGERGGLYIRKDNKYVYLQTLQKNGGTPSLSAKDKNIILQTIGTKIAETLHEQPQSQRLKGITDYEIIFNAIKDVEDKLGKTVTYDKYIPYLDTLREIYKNPTETNLIAKAIIDVKLVHNIDVNKDTIVEYITSAYNKINPRKRKAPYDMYTQQIKKQRTALYNEYAEFLKNSNLNTFTELTTHQKRRRGILENIYIELGGTDHEENTYQYNFVLSVLSNMEADETKMLKQFEDYKKDGYIKIDDTDYSVKHIKWAIQEALEKIHFENTTKIGHYLRKKKQEFLTATNLEKQPNQDLTSIKTGLNAVYQEMLSDWEKKFPGDKKPYMMDEKHRIVKYYDDALYELEKMTRNLAGNTKKKGLSELKKMTRNLVGNTKKKGLSI